MTVGDMDSLRVKLTYGGPQDRPILSVAFCAHGRSVPMGWFVPYRRAGFDYGNDFVGALVFTASRGELKDLIDHVGTLPAITNGTVDAKGYLSFALLSTAGSTTRVFEKIVNRTNGPGLFAKLLLAMGNNAAGSTLLHEFGCDVGMLPSDPPVEVGNQVAVKFTGFRPDRAAKTQFVGTVTITNTSASTLPAPVTLVLVQKRGNANVLEKDGYTCNISPGGAPFVNLPLASDFPPGMIAQVTVRIANPTLDKFDLDFKVYAGPGTR